MGRRYRGGRHGRGGGGGNLVTCILSIPIFLIIVGVILAVGAYEVTYCSNEYIGPKEQTYCKFDFHSRKETAIVEVAGSSGSAGLTSYIFTKEPKSASVTETLPDHKMQDVSFSSFNVNSPAGSTVAFHINTTELVDVEFVGMSNGRSTVIYEKKNVQNFGSSISIDEYYSNPHFVISSGSYRFDGVLSVTVSSYLYDVDSIKNAGKCNIYPCEWDLESDEFVGRNVFVITENRGSSEYRVFTGQKEVSYGKLIGGIICAALGSLLIVGGCVLCLICLFK